VRERLWCLALLTVDPGAQSAGAGRALLEHALAYGAGGEAGLIVGSSDPRALRLYGRAGFALHPTFDALGPLHRRALPAADRAVREATGTDVEALAAISREVRGGPHTAELEFAFAAGAHVLRHGDRGFAVALPGHGVWLLVARDDAAASALLWAALELVGDVDGPVVRWITAEQTWAVDVALRAGLRPAPFGALCVRGRPGPLRPFLPSGPFA
jgi:ribosomal protein S18 acetylase RimI-like enzyme